MDHEQVSETEALLWPTEEKRSDDIIVDGKLSFFLCVCAFAVSVATLGENKQRLVERQVCFLLPVYVSSK